MCSMDGSRHALISLVVGIGVSKILVLVQRGRSGTEVAKATGVTGCHVRFNFMLCGVKVCTSVLIIPLDNRVSHSTCSLRIVVTIRQGLQSFQMFL